MNATSARRARGRARTASSPFVAWPCTACATAAARVRDRDAWGRTPAGRLRTTLPRPCRARHAVRDARQVGGAHRLLVLVAHSGSQKTARANYAPKTLPLWQGAKAESAQRACLSAAAGCGQRGRARSERRERRDGRAREAAPAHVHASAGWLTSACKDRTKLARRSSPSLERKGGCATSVPCAV